MAKTITIFDNYYSNERYDEARKEYIENYGEEPTEQQVWDFLFNWEGDDFNCFEREMEQFINDHYYGFLAIGSCGLWNGTFAAGTLIEDFNDLMKLWKNCDYLSVTDEGGHLYVSCTHHDGSNGFELKLLTETGYNIISDYLTGYGTPYWDKYSEEELHKIMFNSTRYTKLPHFAREVYGCKTR